jgi:hypothetical protein
VRWLLDEGGPVIRYRTATELMPDARGLDLPRLRRELLGSALVRRWLERVTPETGFNDLHGSRADCLENALGKLVQLGCRAGMRPLDRRTRPLRSWLRASVPEAAHDNDLVSAYRRNVAAKFLLLAGYDEPAVLQTVRERLERVAGFARRGDYDVYVAAADYPGFPKRFRGRGLVDPAITRAGETPLPSIRDVHAFAALRRGADPGTRARIDAVARYFSHPAYARLERGYGVARLEHRRFWAIGWDVRLPERDCGLVLQNLELFAQLPSARRSRGFRRWLERLARFRTSEGRYRFPRALLPERSSGYWVAGSYLGLEERRRGRRALELESTFWALRIQSLARERRRVRRR